MKGRWKGFTARARVTRVTSRRVDTASMAGAISVVGVVHVDSDSGRAISVVGVVRTESDSPTRSIQPCESYSSRTTPPYLNHADFLQLRTLLLARCVS